MKKTLELYNKNKEIINYLIVGGLTTIVSLATYFIIINIILPDKSAINIQIANVVSWIWAVAFAYIANKIFVFESKKKGKEAFTELVKFVEARIFTLFIDMILMYLFVTVLNINDTIMKIIIAIIVTILNYILSKIIVFKKTRKAS